MVMTESGGIRSGTEVRVAGIPVGKVTDVRIAGDHVEAKISAKSSVFVGADSRIDVRMLTVVGGVFVDLDPRGSQPLGGRPIPAEHVSIPYESARLMDDSAAIVEEIDGPVARQTMNSLITSLKGAPQALHNTVANAEQITEILLRQRVQMRSALDLATEYTTVLADNKEAIRSMIISATDTIPVLLGYRDQGLATIWGITLLIDKVIAFLSGPYREAIAPIVEDLVASKDSAQGFLDQVQATITKLTGILDALRTEAADQGITVDSGNQTIDLPSACIPIAGRTC
ncbi:MCE family protein [Nocardia uniformis]|uniref:MCE family protein n=1 Tax=Nocardia uniformis TaxID=53432 RepID=A0A849BWA9_9NOCA|nr:MlaD family protein [Nocardia uniformis]NNH70883.1 MCE family protein [Nocardia uniformis]